MLQVDGVTVVFGGVRALSEVSFRAEAGHVTGLIGPNGAGKTTLFNVITGLQRPSGGRVLVEDHDLSSLSPTRRARLGVARTFQRLELFGALTAAENIQVAAELRAGRGGDPVDVRAVVDEIVNRLGLADVAAVPADILPTGLARLVELGRALASAPKVVLLDEPSSGLNHVETEELATVLVELAAAGMAVVLVEHDMDLVMRVSDRVWVLDSGELIASGPPAEVQRDPKVRLAYLGPDPTESAEPGPPAVEGPTGAVVVNGSQPPDVAAPDVAAPALELRGIRAGYGAIEVLHGVDLAVRQSSVFALLGPNGAGKSTTLKVASGRLRATAGRVELLGKDVTGRSAEKLTRMGACTIPEGRGIFPNLTVSENLGMWTHKPGCSRAQLDEQTYSRFPRLGARRRQLAGSLSGGEQQMLAMSRALGTNPSVLLLDEISMGLAPMVVAELYETVANLAHEGIAILIIEQAAHVALSLASEAAVMVTGRIVASGEPSEIEAIATELYLGVGAAPAE